MNVVEITSEATGVSVSCINKIMKEGKNSLEKGELSFSTPTKKKLPRKKRIEVDGFTDCAIRQKIHSFYVVKKERPTVKKLLADLKEDGAIDCGREFLRNRITKIGFEWKRCQPSRKML